MAKKPHETNQRKNPVLLKSRQEVSDFLQKSIQIGRDFLKRPIMSEADFNALNKENDKWKKNNLEYLRHSFDTEAIAEEYDCSSTSSLYINPSLSQEVESLVGTIERQVGELESIDERLLIFQEFIASNLGEVEQVNSQSNKVFIVHGHDEALKHQVARFVKALGLSEIILDEQPSAGMTIIEKFERYAQGVRYAIVLLTEDDMGYPKGFPEQAKPRARQNAIAELGYFLKALGRKNFAILSSHQIEIPSDFNGVLYLSTNGGWELKLAKEMREAGLDIDLNKL